MVEVEKNVSEDDCNASITPAVPSSSSPSTVSAAETTENLVEPLAAEPQSTDQSEHIYIVPCVLSESEVQPCSLQGPVTSSSALFDLDSRGSSGANLKSSAASGTSEAVTVCPSKLLQSSESSPALSQCSEEISANSKSQFSDQKRTDSSFPNSRSTSSSSLLEMSDNRRSKTTNANQNRKRRYDDEVPECGGGGLMFDKVPNYYTALSIPARVKAGSAARSSSDLIADFMHNERDPSPERKSCSVYDKLPAYYSSFTNSTRYDDRGDTLLTVDEDDFSQDYMEDDVGRYGRSCDDSYELHDLKSADDLTVGISSIDDDCGTEEETNTENVSCFALKT